MTVVIININNKQYKYVPNNLQNIYGFTFKSIFCTHNGHIMHIKISF